MRTACAALLAVAAPLPALANQLPPIRSANDAVMQLGLTGEQRQLAALANLKDACRGSMRLALRDQPAVLARLKALAGSGTPAVKKAVLDAGPCATPAAFAPIVSIELEAADPGVVAYAAEAAARTEDPVVVGPLLAAFEKRKPSCMKPGLPREEVEVCVWLTYAPGAALGKADEALRKRSSGLAVEAFDSPYAKMREVAVETVASSRVSAHAPALEALIAREKKKGGFEQPNDAALIRRFEQRLAALRKAK